MIIHTYTNTYQWWYKIKREWVEKDQMNYLEWVNKMVIYNIVENDWGEKYTKNGSIHILKLKCMHITILSSVCVL